MKISTFLSLLLVVLVSTIILTKNVVIECNITAKELEQPEEPIDTVEVITKTIESKLMKSVPRAKYSVPRAKSKSSKNPRAKSYGPRAKSKSSKNPRAKSYVPTEKQLDFVKRFAGIAQLEMEKYHIPASITLSQAILESKLGQSRLARNNNNFFGIKCFARRCKKGHCSNFHDDHHKDFFKKYESPWASFRDHSKFLQKSRYASLFDLPRTDYEGWARGLKKAGYATDKRYAHKLIQLIEGLNLTKYDTK